MLTRARWIALALLLCGSAAAPAQESMLDLMPPGAFAAVSVRSLSDLRKKGDHFLKESGIQIGLRPSQLIDEAYKHLKVQGEVDEDRPAAIVLMDPRSIGEDRGIELRDLEQSIVVAIPFKDRDRIGSRFGLRPGELKPGKLAATGRPAGEFGKFLTVRGTHLFLGNHEKVVAFVADGKPVRQELPAERVKRLNESDLLILLGQRGWQEILRAWENDLKKLLDRDALPEERKALALFLDSARGVRHAIGGVRLDDGFGLQVTVSFAKDNGAAGKLLALLRGGDEPSGLRGLPAGNVVAAQALQGDGAATAAVAKLVFHELLRNFMETGAMVSAAERPLLVGVFDEIWRHLKGGRTALYLNADERRQGLFSLVAILDTEDAAGFLREMKTLARIADGSGLKLDPAGGTEEAIDLAKLTAELANPLYRVRAQAALKLRLAGEPALPHLARASRSDDPDVATWAKRLHAEITELAAQRRKDLLSKDPLRRIRPTFALIPAAEKRAGHTIDVLRVRLGKADEEFRPTLQQLLGPEWHNIRLATHGKRVVVLLGSDTALLEEALKNLDQKRPGLAGEKQLTQFYGRAGAARRFELHVALEPLLGLIDQGAAPAATAKKAPAVSSLGLSVETNLLQLDVWVPFSELRVAAKKNPLF